ncbi:predicted protein [Uncinocarpus reesii 1704]|uniref:Uncharacterized protein n=1 Tax=Uncinocarpus reesii (strain UAMH 1704) TaxID=336963 RepID=C4JZT6_UNCRE|nr:uncharacterized protein UREG_07687 [Uncinocarpus reesii 1704]EEP82822.1 predicted protein [Uncinocarpus reesii 1704]
MEPGTGDKSVAVHDTELPRKEGNDQSSLLLAPSDKEAQSPLEESSLANYKFKRYIFRAVLNVLGPVIVTLFYFLILRYYLWEPAENEIIPSRPVDAKGVFFAWLILGIFVLDWAKAGVAGFEATALMKPEYAPADGHKLMWHIDRGWGSLSTWWQVLLLTFGYVGKKIRKRPAQWEGPGLLWFYLAFSSILFYAAVPLSGLSMDPSEAFVLGSRPITIVGTNQSTFDSQPSNAIAELASYSWRQGRSTTPEQPTILYAPDGTQNVSSTFYEDVIRSDYQSRLLNSSSPLNHTITFFSGPEVGERAHGRAWGMLTNISCMPVHPYRDLELLKVTAINNWTSTPWTITSQDYANGTYLPYISSGSQPVHFAHGEGLGVKYQYVMASDLDISYGIPAYTNETNMPVSGAVEMVLWQAYDTETGYIPDQTFKNLSSHPLVQSSFSKMDNRTYLGYGVRCYATSTTGQATISPITNTFKDFKQEAAELVAARYKLTSIFSYSGVVAMPVLVFAAFTTVNVGYQGPPKCDTVSIICNGWVGANLATNGVPQFTPIQAAPPDSGLEYIGGYMQYPTISPERMNLAMYKLFGEVSIAAMASGPGNWTSTPNATSDLGLFGLEPANDIVQGRVPYHVVLVLLLLWAVVTIVPQLLLPGFFLERRWGETLDGFTMFRFGAEWKETVHKLRSTELDDPGTMALSEVPGMIGDMNAGEGGTGFVGLSREKASLRKVYSYAR